MGSDKYLERKEDQTNSTQYNIHTYSSMFTLKHPRGGGKQE